MGLAKWRMYKGGEEVTRLKRRRERVGEPSETSGLRLHPGIGARLAPQGRQQQCRARGATSLGGGGPSWSQGPGRPSSL